MAKKKKKRLKKRDKLGKPTYLSRIKNFLSALYHFAVWMCEPLHIPFRKKKKPYLKFRAVNRIYKMIYKRKELQIKDFKNIQLCDFESEIDHLKLKGLTYTPHPESNKWVIACHWFTGDKWWGLFNTMPFIKMGYNVMAFDFRGHGDSEKQNPTMGVKCSRDLLGAIKWLNANRKVDYLALTGISMGAYVISYASVKFADFMRENKVQFGVCESPYGSIQSLFMYERNRWLPAFVPKRKTKALVEKLMYKINTNDVEKGFDIFSGNIFKLLNQGIVPAYPIFYSHSKDDVAVPFYDTSEIVNKREKLIKGDRFCIYNYSMHTQNIRVHFKTYSKALAKFIADNDGNEEGYRNLVKEWELDKITSKADKKDEELM